MSSKITSKRRKLVSSTEDDHDIAATKTEEIGNNSTSKDQRDGRGVVPVAFIIAPGARGRDCTELRSVLEKIGPTTSLLKWTGGSQPSSTNNLNALKEVIIQTSNKFPSHRLCLVGHSFGCRVIVALLTSVLLTSSSSSSDKTNKDEDYHYPHNDLPNQLITNRMVLEAYPLYGPSKPKKQSSDRVIPLQNLPNTPSRDLRILFFSGENDEFLNRAKEWRGVGSKTGGAALHEVIHSLNSVIQDGIEVEIVEDGKHN